MCRLKPGGDYSDPGYVSTSFDSKVAADFLRGKPGVVMHVTARRGVEMAGMGLKAGDTQTEAEFLLPRGQRFKVLGVEPGANGSPAVVRLEQLENSVAFSDGRRDRPCLVPPGAHPQPPLWTTR